nr:ribonuclease H-like domain-containing protein [Tanacetum cinerariifolium]
MEYDIWAMKMEHYLSHTDYPIWQVIHNGNGLVSVTIDINGIIKVLPPKTAEEVMARERKRKARTTLLMVLPEDHLAKFHKMADAKEMWEAIKSRFGGNDESKKMHKYLLKQQFKGFSMSASEGLHKGYDRFQTLLSQLEIHDAGVSHNDANQKFLRSLPSFWSQVALIMRTKPGLDTFSFDDLYNNLRVFERDVKGTTASSSNTYNVAFVSAKNTSSTNDVSTAYSVSSHSILKSQKEGSSSYTDEVIHSFFVNQSSAPQLDYDDLEQINDDDMEEMDSKWQASDVEDTPVNDRFADGMHATSADESDSKPSEYASCESDSSLETSTSMPEQETIKEIGTTNHSPKIKKKDRNCHTRMGLGYAFTKKACFVCGSFSHLIRDCDFHEKRMAKQAELTKSKNKFTMSNTHQELASPEANGFCKELASPKHTALGKDISIPLMADRLPKTTFQLVYTYYCQLKVNAASLKLTTASHYGIRNHSSCYKLEVQLLKLGDMSHHKDIYDNPSLTKKVFANMKRVSTGFSRVVTSLFDNMLVPTEPYTLKPYKKHKPKKQQTQAPKVPSPEPLPEHMLPSLSNDPLPGGKDSLKLKELMDLCTHLSNKVLKLESEVIHIKSTYKERIEKIEGRVDRLEEENRLLKELHSVHSKVDTATPIVEKEKSFKQGRIIADIDEDDVDDEEPAEIEEVLEVVTAVKLIIEVTTTTEATKVSVPRRRRGVVIQDPEETTAIVVVHSEFQSKDKGKDILIEEPKSLKGQQVKRSERLNDAVIKYQALKRKPLTEAQARKNMIIYKKNMAEEVNEEVIVPEKEVKVEGHKRDGESLDKEITKKQKMDEEAEEFKSHLQIVSDDDDDVYTEATPLASKILIVDYKIHLERNKPYFKII